MYTKKKDLSRPCSHSCSSSIITHSATSTSASLPFIAEAHTHKASSRPPLPASKPACLALHAPKSPDTSPQSACLVLPTPSAPRPVSSSLLLVLVGPPNGFAGQSLPSCAVHRAGDGAAPTDVVQRAAGADAGDDVDVVAAAAPVAIVVEAGLVAGAVVPAVAVALPAAELPAVELPVVALPAVVPDAVALPADAANVGSMTHKARGECWVQQVSTASTVMEAAAVVAGDEYEIAWLGTMSCVSGRTVAADLVRGFFARLGKMAAKMAGES